MAETRRTKTAYLDERKREIVEAHGCVKCQKGKTDEGFERYWHSDQYEAGRFVFKYVDPQESDVPMARLPRIKHVTVKVIEEALARSVVFCRSCADMRRSRKETTPCLKTSITDSLQRSSS
jgi:hypothetical protein